MALIAVKKLRGKGRKVTFSMKADGLDLTNTVAVSMRLLDSFSVFADKEIDDAERSVVMRKLNLTLVGESNWPILLEWLEENVDGLEGDQEAIGELVGEIFEHIVPKAPASTPDKP